jgi:hypothetical protein
LVFIWGDSSRRWRDNPASETIYFKYYKKTMYKVENYDNYEDNITEVSELNSRKNLFEYYILVFAP